MKMSFSSRKLILKKLFIICFYKRIILTCKINCIKRLKIMSNAKMVDFLFFIICVSNIRIFLVLRDLYNYRFFIMILY